MIWVLFFFQAEDGIRDGRVTGVQTCALPIWQLMATYQAPIYNYVLRLVGGDAALAEDLCQEIFMKVHQGLPGFNMQCRFTTWLFQIAKYRVLDELRARERRVQTPIELDRVPPAAIAAAPEVGFEQMDAVFRAIG